MKCSSEETWLISGSDIYNINLDSTYNLDNIQPVDYSRKRIPSSVFRFLDSKGNTVQLKGKYFSRYDENGQLIDKSNIIKRRGFPSYDNASSYKYYPFYDEYIILYNLYTFILYNPEKGFWFYSTDNKTLKRKLITSVGKYYDTYYIVTLKDGVYELSNGNLYESEKLKSFENEKVVDIWPVSADSFLLLLAGNEFNLLHNGEIIDLSEKFEKKFSPKEIYDVHIDWFNENERIFISYNIGIAEIIL